jgi:DNA-binding NarL/FixJ family response regulator
MPSSSVPPSIAALALTTSQLLRRPSRSRPNSLIVEPAGASGRERDVLVHVARGFSQRQVAHALDISVKTVQHHLEGVMDKLDIHDRVELARYAIREGIVEP